MAVTVSTPTAAALAASTTTTFSHVGTTGPLYVRVSWWDASHSITGITWAGSGSPVALTRVAQSAVSNGNDRCEIWRLLAPAAATANIVVTFDASISYAGRASACNSSGQDTGTPEGTAATNKSAAGGTGTGSLAVSGNASGDLTLVVIVNGNGAAVTPAATGGGAVSEEYDTADSGERSEAFKVPDACTAVSGSWTGSTSWAIAAIPLKATAAATTVRTLALLGAGA